VIPTRSKVIPTRSKVIPTRRKYDLEIPEDILNAVLRQADGVYLALAGRMAEDGEWVDGLWNIKERLVLVAVYGSKNIGPVGRKTPP